MSNLTNFNGDLGDETKIGPSLKEKLKRLSSMEEEHSPLGISMLSKDHSDPLPLERVIDYTIAILNRSIYLTKNRENIPEATYS